jgi:hypothetical protein
MIFSILKMFGLDIPAKIEAAKASLERRVEHATDHVKLVARQAAVVAALYAAAALTAATAAGVGFIALYRWAAEAYGVYAGLGIVGTILIVVTAILATAAAIKGKSLAASGLKVPHRPADSTGELADSGIGNPSEVPSAGGYVWEAPDMTTRIPSPGAASDLVEPLALLLSKIVKYPSLGNPIVDELLNSLRTTARGTADEAVNSAANMIRYGDRTNLVVVLTGAAFVGWLLSHHSRQSTMKS